MALGVNVKQLALVVDHSADRGLDLNRKTWEALMVGVRSDRARARAKNLLATVYPAPNDAEFHRLRQLAVEYVQEAERLEREQKGSSTASDELISAALDEVARNYFVRALAHSRRSRTG